ncbi:MAG TPA: hypothetical protein VMU82_02490 [Acetobacteraceae bacterium]|nr:hypothetical protein [Acetobacteraceae bacterium]
MIRRVSFLLGSILAGSILAASAMAAVPSGSRYKTQAAAQQVCGSDPVVWANTRSKVFHLPGDRYFGKTKSGAYVCQKVAEAAGMHASGHRAAKKKP